MPPKRTRKARVFQFTPGRFSNGLDWVSGGYAAPSSEPIDPTAIHFEIVRPDDLVALSIDAIGCELLTDGKRPAHLRPIANHSFPRLVVRHAFQHVGEEASYEGQAGRRIVPPEFWGPPPATEHPIEEPNHAEPNAPVNGRAARASRLVFRIPAGRNIEFSTRGILAALSELELHVHDLARPGDAPLAGRSGRGAATPPVVSPFSPTELTVGRFVATVSDNALTLARARRRPRGQELPPAGSLARTAYEARELRRARIFLQSRPAVFETEASARDARTLGDLLGERPSIRPDVAQFISERSKRPEADETAIEAPFRLLISPSEEARWAHAVDPVPAEGEPGHIELWPAGWAASASARTERASPTRRTAAGGSSGRSGRATATGWPRTIGATLVVTCRLTSMIRSACLSTARIVTCSSSNRAKRFRAWRGRSSRFPLPPETCGCRASAPGSTCTERGTPSRIPLPISGRSSPGITSPRWGVINTSAWSIPATCSPGAIRRPG